MNLKCVICPYCQIVRCLLSFDYTTRGDKSPALPPTIMEVEILVKETHFEVYPIFHFHFFQMDFLGKKKTPTTYSEEEFFEHFQDG